MGKLVREIVRVADVTAGGPDAIFVLGGLVVPGCAAEPLEAERVFVADPDGQRPVRRTRLSVPASRRRTDRRPIRPIGAAKRAGEAASQSETRASRHCLVYPRTASKDQAAGRLLSMRQPLVQARPQTNSSRPTSVARAPSDRMSTVNQRAPATKAADEDGRHLGTSRRRSHISRR
jgi:hypothetical protein